MICFQNIYIYIYEIIIKLSSFPTDYLLWSSVRQTEIVMQWKKYEMKIMSPKQSTGMKLCGQTKKT
jgi:hypothetical protein